MRRTVYNHVKTVRALNTTSVSGNGNTDGTAIDLDQSGADFREVVFVIMLGDITDGTYTAVPQESADGSTGWTNVPAARLLGSAAVSADHAVGEIGVIPDPGTARFVRLRVTASAVTSGGPVSGVALLGSPSSTPVAHS